MYELLSVITAWCVTATALLVEHLLFWHRLGWDTRGVYIRHVLGVLAYWLGVLTWALLTGRWLIGVEFIVIGTAGGIVLCAYWLREVNEREREWGRVSAASIRRINRLLR